MIIEIIATSVEEAITAEKYGADRIELIHSFDQGGLSPQLELSRQVCEAVNIPVNVMVRPHGNSFCYSNTDIERIMLELSFLRDNTRASSIVFGALDNKDNIDKPLVEKIIGNKGRLGLTFHRAVDVAKNTLQAYKELLAYPQIDLVLTSGGKDTAMQGADIIKQMVELSSERNSCSILAGSGISPANAADLIALTGVKQIHLGTGVREQNILSKNKFDKLIMSIAV